MANSQYATNGLVGAAFLKSGPVPSHAVGQIAMGKGDSEWVYGLCTAAVTGPGYVVQLDQNFNATMLTTANAGGRGAQLGVAPIAMNSGDYGWFQRSGPCNIQVSASTAARTRLNTTTTPGQLGSDATVGSGQVEGMVLIAAQGASAGLGAALGTDELQITANN